MFHQSELSVFIKFDNNEVSGNVTERSRIVTRYPGTLLKEPINANHQSIRKCLKLISVLTSGPMTVGSQRGTCHMRTGCRGPEVKTQKCMHKYYLDMYSFCIA